MAIGSNRQFRGLCTILDAERLVENPKYATNAARVKHRETLAKLLRDKIKKREADPLLAQCRSKLVPAAEIKNLQQVFEEQKAREMLLRETVEGRDTVRPKTTVFHIKS
ncbi:MAG: CoA transferase [Fodinibius sp.]|nr:CoA transferase [Fodinibius sp.]